MATNTILKMMTGGMEDEDLLELDQMNFDEFSTKATKEFRHIPLDSIRKRNINDYSISDIETLAKSIIENGLQQHIVVRTNGNNNDEYILIAGERRVSAYHWIIEKYKAEGKNFEQYLTIPADVYTSISQKQEEEIYRTTNDTQRNSSVFERIYRFNPCEKFFFKSSDTDGFEKTNIPDIHKIAEYFALKSNEPKFQFAKTFDELAKQVYDIGIKGDQDIPFISHHQNINGDVVTIRWNNPLTMNDYIKCKLNHMYSDISISIGTIRQYTNWISTTYKPIIREFIFCQNPPISPRDLRTISILSYEEQLQVYEQLKNGTYTAKVEKFEPKEETVVTYEAKFGTYLKEMESLVNKFEVNDFVGHKKELTGNQKELLKDVQKILKTITKLSEKPH